jgi:foldase protein PrsA
MFGLQPRLGRFFMASFLRMFFPLALALALAATAACGGGGPKEVPAGAIAVVGDAEIPRAEFDRLLKQAEASYKAQQQEVPKPGTPAYAELRNALVKSLVDQKKFEQEAEDMGIEVSDAEVNKRLTELIQQFFGGDRKKYEADIKKQGVTDARVREQLRLRILSEKVFKEVTKDVKVTDADVKAYYDKNKAQFERPETREVRHILVKKKALADDLYRRIKGGANFAKLASQYTQDDSSKKTGGKLPQPVTQGQTQPAFDKFVFAADEGDLSKPLKTSFGWHVVEVLAINPKGLTPLAEAKPSIRQTLLRQKQNETMQKWVKDLDEKYEDEIAYAPGFAPPKSGTTTGETGSGG